MYQLSIQSINRISSQTAEKSTFFAFIKDKVIENNQAFNRPEKYQNEKLPSKKQCATKLHFPSRKNHQ
jgi:hypothetical protein